MSFMRNNPSLDDFARDFLLFASTKLGLKLPWLPKIKVIECNDREWIDLYPISRKGISGAWKEYSDNTVSERIRASVEMWNTVNGWGLKSVGYDDSGQVSRTSGEDRQKGYEELGFEKRTAQYLAPYDAVTFLHTSTIDLAKERDKPLALESVLAHETIHIIEAFCQVTIIRQFDHKTYFEHPLVVGLVKEFVGID